MKDKNNNIKNFKVLGISIYKKKRIWEELLTTPEFRAPPQNPALSYLLENPYLGLRKDFLWHHDEENNTIKSVLYILFDLVLRKKLDVHEYTDRRYVLGYFFKKNLSGYYFTLAKNEPKTLPPFTTNIFNVLYKSIENNQGKLSFELAIHVILDFLIYPNEKHVNPFVEYHKAILKYNAENQSWFTLHKTKESYFVPEYFYLSYDNENLKKEVETFDKFIAAVKEFITINEPAANIYLYIKQILLREMHKRKIKEN
ncbi:hypothetical protein [Lishizhenia sp.]|uniref:hypothetical protein n=1 Tax=Lishizhenia sp. TaxID=2497594 RepID=UPI00299D7B89|nr:hypothetical protein [Lishizhenia sp.]MDX1446731.1 hypothetical protein [Lishizhenia sp.]